MYYIGLDVHKKTISYCVKDAARQVHREGKIGSTRRELDARIKTLPQPRTIAMEATIFTGWIYDHLLPHAEKVKAARPLMLRAIAVAKKKNDKIDARKIADCLRCDFLPECHNPVQHAGQLVNACSCSRSDVQCALSQARPESSCFSLDNDLHGCRLPGSNGKGQISRAVDNACFIPNSL